MSVTRRSFFARAGAIATAQGLALKAQQAQKQPPVDPGATPQDPRMGVANVDKIFKYSDRHSKVGLVKGDNRRKNVTAALVAIDDQIRPGLKTRKYVLIKPNGGNPTRQLISTQADTIHGILDYLEPRYKGPIVVAEVSGTPAKQATSQFGWDKIFAEHKHFSSIKFEVPNEDESKYELLYGMDYDMHLVPIRLAARLLDPDAFVISSAALKTHNMVVATMTIKNMVLGAAMTPPPGVTRPWGDSDKRKFHVGIRAGNYNMYLGAQRMMHNWGVGLVDGFEGMEGNGPVSGVPVPSRIAIASTDFLAADRVSLECMGIDASWPGYLNYAYQGGLGQYDLSKIEVVGAKIADVQKKYRLHADVDRMLEWRGPMLDLPPNLGRNRRPMEEDLSGYYA